MRAFTFYESWLDAVNDPTISDTDFRSIIIAMTKYALDREELPLSGIPKIVFNSMKPMFDDNFKRKECGKKGGRPKSEKPMESSDTVNGIPEERREEKPTVIKTETDGYENKTDGYEIKTDGFQEVAKEERSKEENIYINNNISNAKDTNNKDIDNALDKLNKKEKVNQKEKDEHADEVCMIVDYLNKKTGAKYSPDRQDTKRKINGRLNEGFTIDDFKRVIDCKVAEWTGTDMARYIQPSTLFAVGHFEEYLEQARKTRTYKVGDDLDDVFF